ncbi:MAG: sulfatase [Candidatus Poribacteria bacterium]|nr:sulfatase [Candidatus Poribacteria bacterium]
MALKKPNIVVYLSDDHGSEYLGCYGNGHIQTPHLDSIAEDGIRFTHAFTPTPTCAPSRSTLYTGLYPARHGAMGNHTECHAHLKALPGTLRELGYRVAIAGKTHVKPETLFDFEYIGGFLPKRAEHRRKYRAEGLDPVPVERFLSSHRQENPDQPICLILGDSNPHVTWEPNKTYDPDALPLPPYIADTPITRKALANYYQDISTMDTRIGEVDKMLETHGYADNMLFIYTTDHGAEWPHCKWTLYDTGTRLPFIARWRGEIPANTVSDAMISHVDFFPTLIDIAGGEPLDDLDGESFKSVLFGQQATFRDKIYGTHTRDGNMNVFPQRCVRDTRYKYILNLMPENTWTTHFTEVEGIPESHAEVWKSWLKKAETDPQTAQLVYLTQHHPLEELYDVATDPYEFNNLAFRAETRPILEKMRADVRHWMQSQNDDGRPETCNPN